MQLNVAVLEPLEELLALCTTKGVEEEIPAAGEEEMVLLGVGLPVLLPVAAHPGQWRESPSQHGVVCLC